MCLNQCQREGCESIRNAHGNTKYCEPCKKLVRKEKLNSIRRLKRVRELPLDQQSRECITCNKTFQLTFLKQKTCLGDCTEKVVSLVPLNQCQREGCKGTHSDHGNAKYCEPCKKLVSKEKLNVTNRLKKVRALPLDQQSRACIVCQKTFQLTYVKQKACIGKCTHYALLYAPPKRDIHRIKRIKKDQWLECERCMSGFPSQIHNALYCSERCSNEVKELKAKGHYMKPVVCEYLCRSCGKAIYQTTNRRPLCQSKQCYNERRRRSYKARKELAKKKKSRK